MRAHRLTKRATAGRRRPLIVVKSDKAKRMPHSAVAKINFHEHAGNIAMMACLDWCMNTADLFQERQSKITFRLAIRHRPNVASDQEDLHDTLATALSSRWHDCGQACHQEIVKSGASRRFGTNMKRYRAGNFKSERSYHRLAVLMAAMCIQSHQSAVEPLARRNASRFCRACREEVGYSLAGPIGRESASDIKRA